MTAPEVTVLETPATLAGDVAARLVTTVLDALRARGQATLALTAGSIMEQVWASLAGLAAAADVDWSSVDVFWGDERFVPADSDERNDRPAERILFATAPFAAARRHSMPAAGGEFGDDLDAAAAGYAATLQAAGRAAGAGPGSAPGFDVVLLGVGPDGHCCSLFPGHPAVRDPAPVVAVRNSPKPPPLRLSFGFSTLNGAREVWVVASGAGKAEAVARALGGHVSADEVPSSAARGTVRTLWLLDRDAARELH